MTAQPRFGVQPIFLWPPGHNDDLVLRPEILDPLQDDFARRIFVHQSKELFPILLLALQKMQAMGQVGQRAIHVNEHEIAFIWGDGHAAIIARQR